MKNLPILITGIALIAIAAWAATQSGHNTENSGIKRYQYIVVADGTAIYRCDTISGDIHLYGIADPLLHIHLSRAPINRGPGKYDNLIAECKKIEEAKKNNQTNTTRQTP